MSQSDVGRARAADKRSADELSEETRSFVRTVKAATRRRHTPEEKIRIVLEGFRCEVTVNAAVGDQATLILRMAQGSFGRLRAGFMEAGNERLTREPVRDDARHEIQQLERYRWYLVMTEDTWVPALC